MLKLSSKAAAFCDQSEHIEFVKAGFNFDGAVLMNVAACQEKNLFNVTFLEIPSIFLKQIAHVKKKKRVKE